MPQTDFTNVTARADLQKKTVSQGKVLVNVQNCYNQSTKSTKHQWIGCWKCQWTCCYMQRTESTNGLAVTIKALKASVDWLLQSKHWKHQWTCCHNQSIESTSGLVDKIKALKNQWVDWNISTENTSGLAGTLSTEAPEDWLV